MFRFKTKFHFVLPIILIIFVSECPQKSLSCMSLRSMDDFYDRIGSRYSDNNYNNSDRNQKHRLVPIPFLTKVLISPEQCTAGSKDEIGVCVKKSFCEISKGASLGQCAYGQGTCCLHKTRCKSRISRVTTNLTHLVPSGSDSDDFRDVCRYEIPKQKGVAQVRLDFVKFMINEGPNVRFFGDCVEDTLMITGARNARGVVGPLCGDLSGQHMFLDFGESNNLNIDIYRKEDLSQKWDIVVTFIKRQSTEKAPEGCLQYFTESRGTVKSFNYNLQHQINNQDYSICIKTNPGMTKIMWKGCGQPRGYDFVMSTNPPAIPSNPGAPVVGNSYSGNTCATDWVMVLGVNKYCGNVFPSSVSSTSQPFMLQVKFNSREYLPQTPTCDPLLPDLPPECWSDEDNSGFCLEYSQSAA